MIQKEMPSFFHNQATERLYNKKGLLVIINDLLRQIYMTKLEIINLCKEKEQELLNTYFGNLVHEASIERPATISEYAKDLPLKIEAEFREYLEGLWKQYAPAELQGTPLVLEEQELRQFIIDEDCEGIEAAYQDAFIITLWGKITKTNNKDVTYYKGASFRLYQRSPFGDA